MIFRGTVLLLLLAVAGSFGCSSQPDPDVATDAGGEPIAEKSPAEQLAELEEWCSGATEAIAQRQAEQTLHDRLGGAEGIRTIATALLDRHLANPKLEPLFGGVDRDPFIENVTTFLTIGTGGQAEYKGRDPVEVHKDMGVTLELFIEAAGDLDAAMIETEVAANERQEVMCSFISLRSMAMPPAEPPA
ncbi:MAG: group 1 truncated hemoglobin [bacterium]|nr:group 1 truncated hemoglobin [bacterium]